MRKRLSIPYPLVVAVILLGICVSGCSAGARLSVTAVDTLDLPGENAYLSPDGTSIAVLQSADVHNSKICIYTATGREQVCSSLKMWLDKQSIRWSPDSQHLAFTDVNTENGDRTIISVPHIWVMDANNGKATNLTPQSKFNYLPRWSSDSKSLVFLHYTSVGNKYHTVIYTINASGGTPVRRGELTPPGYAVNGFAWTADGTHLVYNTSFDTRGTIFAVWLADLNGKNARKIASEFLVHDLSLSADSLYVYTFRLGEFGSSTNENRILPIAGGDVRRLNRVAYAGWSPSGHMLIYIGATRFSLGSATSSNLYLMEKLGEPGKRFYEGKFKPPAEMQYMLTWAKNNTVLVRRLDDRKFLLLHLGMK